MSALNLELRPDGIAVLTLDQPGSKANVLSSELWTELEALFSSLAGRNDLSGLVIRSAKPGIFIAGADLKFLQQATAPQDPNVRDFIEHGLRVLESLEALPFPTCAAVDGAALGGGMEVALACDFRVIGSNARAELGLPEVKLGLIPGWGGTQRLPRITSLQLAAEMLSTGNSLKPDRALAEKLVDRATTSEELLDAAISLLKSPNWKSVRERKLVPMAESDRTFRPEVPSSPAAIREGALCLTRGVELPLREAIAIETEAFQRLAGSEESKKMIEAFFAARKK